MNTRPIIRVMHARTGQESYYVEFPPREKGDEPSRHEVTREAGELVCYYLKSDLYTRGAECEGDKYRRSCRHIRSVRRLLPLADLEAAAVSGRVRGEGACAF